MRVLQVPQYKSALLHIVWTYIVKINAPKDSFEIESLKKWVSEKRLLIYYEFIAAEQFCGLVKSWTAAQRVI